MLALAEHEPSSTDSHARNRGQVYRDQLPALARAGGISNMTPGVALNEEPCGRLARSARPVIVTEVILPPPGPWDSRPSEFAHSDPTVQRRTSLVTLCRSSPSAGCSALAQVGGHASRSMRPRIYPKRCCVKAHWADTRCTLGSLAARCGWATCASPAGPSLTSGSARVTGAKASVSTAIAL
jgi:hypothetical protein